MATGAEERSSSAMVDFEEDDDAPIMSSRTLEALKEFLSEQNSLGIGVRGEEGGEADEVRLVTEDWRLSQFWYDQVTAETVVNEIRALCSSVSARVACVSCPTLYAYLKKIEPNISVQLLEYDKRFEQYGGDFTFYDYNQPEDLPQELKHSFQVVVADPPYLSKECLEKVAQTISFLSSSKDFYLLLLTGAVQQDRAAELLKLHPCGFRPQHSNKLGNEFRLYTNYDPEERLGGWELTE
ncbi:EEF1A lysine methyltransferase 1 [Dioscorea cayenensis subsp. rotundata]|uniref:Protein-lysine N-methyltransferase LOC120267475 n=1 Tax=Dioscorea cayennensis subsp. rotundata TaxID=55577 RepID=A0AB40BVV9_DIOCR|nr:EEF1A lysine methyltransferase 1 [Dioscorea cayenensis subsp. rotundata]XP_039131083.1 EEF1A lysine methyltransferase 1 [Dioscorea cayenensis subsp. rotundata]